MPKHCGYVAILGIPNAGKSTLMNTLVGSKLAIVTPKVQTTRNRITGVTIHEDTQVIFIDTPGIFNAEKRFEKAMVASAWSGAADADIVLLLIDAKRGIDDGTQAIINQMKQQKKPAAAILNKIDLVDKPGLLELAVALDKEGVFDQIFMLSAQEGDGVEALLKYLAGKLPQGEWLYPEDHLTEIPMRELAAEVTREQLFLKLHQELPYALMVETEKWEEKKNGIHIHQVIVVMRESQKKIILGKGGAMLKLIGESSRRQMSKLWDTKIHLFLFVKVQEDWKDKPDVYRQLGLDYK